MANILGFHESTVTGIETKGGNISLYLGGVCSQNGAVSVVLDLKEVVEIKKNHVLVHAFTMESPDGEILQLEHDQNALHCLIEWNDFTTRKSTTCEYRLTCNQITERVLDDKP